MNIYVRFFDFDTLVSDEDGVIQFLQAIPDVELMDEIVDEIKDYINSETTYPKRLKIFTLFLLKRLHLLWKSLKPIEKILLMH